MSNMHSIHRNSYLHQRCSINPRIINRCVDKALSKECEDCFDHEPPFQRLVSSQPHYPVDDIDVVRRPQAFGRWALPKLYRQLHSFDMIVVLQAISTVMDLVHDPEKTFEAIRLKFVPRLAGLLKKTKHVTLKERILIALCTIASQAEGRDAILKHDWLRTNLKELIGNNDDIIRCKAAAVIEMLSRSFTAACILIEEHYVPAIIQYLIADDEYIVKFHLDTLEQLFMHALAQEQGLEYEAIEKMVTLLEREDTEIVTKAEHCLALLVSNPDGKLESVEMNLLVKLNDLLNDKRSSVYTAAASVIMFATHTVKSKHQAAAIKGLPERLLVLSNNFNNPASQMFAMKALGNLCEHPNIRKDFFDNHLDEVKDIITKGQEELKRYKDILIKIIEWKPWIG